VNAILPAKSPAEGFERYKTLAATSFDVVGNRGSDHVAALANQRAELDALDELIHSAAQPEVLNFSIRSADGEYPLPSAPKGINVQPHVD